MSLTLTWAWSLALEDGVLPEEATEAGLLGAASFFRTRDLSSPFSGGEWAGLTRGVAGSYRVKWDRQRARLSKQTGGKPLACTCRSNKPGPHVQTQINILMHVHILLLTHTCTHFSFTCHPLFLCILCRTFCMSGKRNTASKHTHSSHTTNILIDFLAMWKGVEASADKRELCLVLCAAFTLKNVTEQLSLIAVLPHWRHPPPSHHFCLHHCPEMTE